MKLTIAILFTSAIIFGGRGFKRWLHKRRMRRNDKYREKLREAYKRKFAEEMAEVNRWRQENEPTEEKHRQNIVCKNPAYAAAWE